MLYCSRKAESNGKVFIIVYTIKVKMQEIATNTQMPLNNVV